MKIFALGLLLFCVTGGTLFAAEKKPLKLPSDAEMLKFLTPAEKAKAEQQAIAYTIDLFARSLRKTRTNDEFEHVFTWHLNKKDRAFAKKAIREHIPYFFHTGPTTLSAWDYDRIVVLDFKDIFENKIYINGKPTFLPRGPSLQSKYEQFKRRWDWSVGRRPYNSLNQPHFFGPSYEVIDALGISKIISLFSSEAVAGETRIARSLLMRMTAAAETAAAKAAEKATAEAAKKAALDAAENASAVAAAHAEDIASLRAIIETQSATVNQLASVVAKQGTGGNSFAKLASTTAVGLVGGAVVVDTAKLPLTDLVKSTYCLKVAPTVVKTLRSTVSGQTTNESIESSPSAECAPYYIQLKQAAAAADEAKIPIEEQTAEVLLERASTAFRIDEDPIKCRGIDSSKPVTMSFCVKSPDGSPDRCLSASLVKNESGMASTNFTLSEDNGQLLYSYEFNASGWITKICRPPSEKDKTDTGSIVSTQQVCVTRESIATSTATPEDQTFFNDYWLAHYYADYKFTRKCLKAAEARGENAPPTAPIKGLKTILDPKLAPATTGSGVDKAP